MPFKFPASQVRGWRCPLNVLWNLNFYQLCTKSPDYTSVWSLTSVCPNKWILIRADCYMNMPERVMSQTVWLLFILLSCFTFQLFFPILYISIFLVKYYEILLNMKFLKIQFSNSCSNIVCQFKYLLPKFIYSLMHIFILDSA